MKPLFSDWKFQTCLESVTRIRRWTMHRPFYTNARLAQITKSNLLPCKLQNAPCVQRIPISCLVNSSSWCRSIFGSLGKSLWASARSRDPERLARPKQWTDLFGAMIVNWWQIWYLDTGPHGHLYVRYLFFKLRTLQPLKAFSSQVIFRSC
jgi:hypothetical protein